MIIQYAVSNLLSQLQCLDTHCSRSLAWSRYLLVLSALKLSVAIAYNSTRCQFMRVHVVHLLVGGSWERGFQNLFVCVSCVVFLPQVQSSTMAMS